MQSTEELQELQNQLALAAVASQQLQSANNKDANIAKNNDSSSPAHSSTPKRGAASIFDAGTTAAFSISEPGSPPLPNNSDTATSQSTSTSETSRLLSKTTLASVDINEEDAKPSTRLAKLLVGQVPIHDHDAPVALDPDLVQETARIIRVTVNEMVEAAMLQTEKELDEEQPRQLTLTQQLELARGIFEERALELQERESTRNQLLEKLRVDAELLTALNLELEQHRRAAEDAEVDFDNDDDYDGDDSSAQSQALIDPMGATVTNLWKQLEGGLAKIQSQDRDVADLQETIRQNALEKERKDALVTDLGAYLDTLQSSTGDPNSSNNNNNPRLLLNGSSSSNRPSNNRSDSETRQQEVDIARLERRKKNLQELLEGEKKYSKQSLQSYMAASIRQLKTRRLLEQDESES